MPAPALVRPSAVPLDQRMALSAADVAKATGLSQRFVMQLALQGKLPSTLVGRRRLFRPADVQAAIFGGK